jgi:hypothetical protein
LLTEPPAIDFRSTHGSCSRCRVPLKVHKTHRRGVSTLHVGTFRAREIVLACPACGRRYPSEELNRLVASGARFGYDVLVYVGRALFLRYRNEQEVVAELAERNIRISPSEVSVLGRKFILYLALAHQRCSPRIQQAMQQRGGYVLHLDGTQEGASPLLISSLDALSEIVLGNVKVPAESEDQLVPFLRRLKDAFGIPVALVHDMGAGILRAVATVFPNLPDFICHFHFLRDIGNDLMREDYDRLRQRLRKHEIHARLRTHAKTLKRRIEPGLLAQLAAGLSDRLPPDTQRELFPRASAYSLILWALEGKKEGDGYGFPFDRPHLSFVKRLQHMYRLLDQMKDVQLSGRWRDNLPYFDLLNDLRAVVEDAHLGQAVQNLQGHILIFDRLREALRIALPAGNRGLNDEGSEANIRSIEQRVIAFRAWLTARPDYPQNRKAANLIAQLDKYWAKLFADPITVQTPSGPVAIQPQRTNNLLEQFFRYLKRAHRRRTGQASTSRLLRTMLAEAPLVKNLQNPAYLALLLDGKATIEEVFADIEISSVREETRKLQRDVDPVPLAIRRLVGNPDYPEKLLAMLKTAIA